MRLSRLAALGAIAVSIGVGVACGASDPERIAPRPHASADAAPVPTSDVEKRLPYCRASSYPTELQDTDPTVGVVDGDARIDLSGSDLDVASYEVYWASDDGTRIGSRVTSLPLPPDRRTLLFHLAAKVPAGATKLLVICRNEKGEGQEGTSVWLGDAVRTVISVGPINSGTSPAVALDRAGAKLLIATGHDDLHVFRCNLDGTGCTHNTVSVPEPLDGARPSIAVDEQGAKLLLTAMRTGSAAGPVLYRCGLDGTACASTALPIASGNNAHSRLAVDKANAKLIVVAEVIAGLGFWRCELDGTACDYRDAQVNGPGANAIGGKTPSLAFDATSGKVIVAVRSGLVVCNADATGCTQSSYPGITELRDPTVAVGASGKFFVVGMMGNETAPKDWKTMLVRCDADASACVATDVGAIRPSLSARAPSVVVDELEGKVMVAVEDLGRPAVLRCQVDGTGCTFWRLSIKLGDGPAAFQDPTSRRLGVVATDREEYKPSLLTVGPWPPSP